MSKKWNWLKKEFREILPVWAFFACAFALLSYTLSEMLGRYHVTLARPHEYLIASLIMAKVVPIVDRLLKTGRFPGRPLIYPSLWNTGVYFLAAILFDLLEHVFSMVRREHLRMGHAIQETLHKMVELRYWAIMVWLVALIFCFAAFRELSRSMGAHQLREMFFGRRSSRRGDSAGTPSAAA